MVIGIDASRISETKKTGVEYYGEALLGALLKLEKKDKIILYSKKPVSFSLPPNFKNKVLKMPYLWTQVRLSLEMIFLPPDILFVPSHTLPLIHPKKAVITIHDLGFKEYSRVYSFLNRLYLNFSTWYSAKTASKIIAISNATKNDIIKYYKISKEKIRVIYLGYKKRKKIIYSILPEKYILFLGRIEKKKNLKRLLEAFKLLKKEKGLPHKLFLIGKDGWGAREIKKEGEGSGVKFLGYRQEEDINILMSNADLLVLPSLYEGFGMTALEAFYLGVPVLASDTKVSREIYKNAAFFTSSFSIEEMKNAMFKVLTDEKLKKNLIKRGLKIAKEFSWEKCALETLEVLKSEINK